MIGPFLEGESRIRCTKAQKRAGYSWISFKLGIWLGDFCKMEGQDGVF